MKLTCIIIDDEPLSHEVLENYISKTPGLQLIHNCFNAIDAIAYMEQKLPDLIFLDINMPELSGLGMLRVLQKKPLVIFTTAYAQYAVDGFDVDAVDFLLKPFSFERFLKATQKATKLAGTKQPSSGDDFITIKTDKKLIRLKLDDIQYLESAGDYVKIKTSEKVYVVNETLKNFEHQLQPHSFIRVHRSFIISLSKVKYLEGNQVFVSETNIPLGNSYKEKLLSHLQ